MQQQEEDEMEIDVTCIFISLILLLLIRIIFIAAEGKVYTGTDMLICTSDTAIMKTISAYLEGNLPTWEDPPTSACIRGDVQYSEDPKVHDFSRLVVQGKEIARFEIYKILAEKINGKTIDQDQIRYITVIPIAHIPIKGRE